MELKGSVIVIITAVISSQTPAVVPREQFNWTFNSAESICLPITAFVSNSLVVLKTI